MIREASFAEVISCEALLTRCMEGLLATIRSKRGQDNGHDDRDKAVEVLLVGAMPLVRGLPGTLVSELSDLAISSLTSPALATQALHAVQCITTMRPAFSRAPALLEAALALPVPSFDAPLAPVAMEVVAAAARAALEEGADDACPGTALSPEDKAAMGPLADSLASSGLTALLVKALAASGSDPGAAAGQGAPEGPEDEDRLAEAITAEGLNLLGLEVALSRALGTAEAHAGLVSRVVRAYTEALVALDSRPVETDLALIKTSRRLVKYLALCVGEARPEAVSPNSDAAYRAVHSLTRGVRSRMADPEAGRVRKAHRQAYEKLRQSAVACVCALFQAAPTADFAASRDQDFWRLAKTLADPVAIAEFAALMARAGTPERAREAANKVAGYLCAGCGEGKGATRGLVMEAAARLVSGPAGALVDVALLAQLCEAVVAECARDPVVVGKSGFPAALTMLAMLPAGACSDSLPGELSEAVARACSEERQGLGAGGMGADRDEPSGDPNDDEMEDDDALTEALSSAYRFFVKAKGPFDNPDALEPIAIALLKAATLNTSREVVFDDEGPLRCLEAEAVPSLLQYVKPEAYPVKVKEMADIWRKQPRWEGDRQAQVDQAIKAMDDRVATAKP